MWSGRGWSVPVFGFGFSVAVEAATEARLDDSSYYQTHRWPLALAALISAVAIWLVDRNSDDRVRRVRDIDTGDLLTVSPNRSTFLYAPLRWYPPLLVAIAAGLGLAEGFT